MSADSSEELSLLSEAKLTPEQKKTLAEKVMAKPGLTYTEKERLLAALGMRTQYAKHEFTVTITGPIGARISAEARRDIEHAVRNIYRKYNRHNGYYDNCPTGVTTQVGPIKRVGEPFPKPLPVKKATKAAKKKSSTTKRRRTGSSPIMNW